MRRAPRRGSGHVLAISLLVLVLVGAAGAAIAVTLQLETRASLQESRRIHLVALSDAALADALAELARSKGFQGAPERRLGRGTIASTVRTLGLDRYEIVATSTYAGWRREVWALVHTGGTRPRVMAWKVLR